MNLEKQTELPLVFAKTIHSFFPKLGQQLNQMNDPRMSGKIDYDINVLIWVGIFMFFLNLNLVEISIISLATIQTAIS